MTSLSTTTTTYGSIETNDADSHDLEIDEATANGANDKIHEQRRSTGRSLFIWSTIMSVILLTCGIFAYRYNNNNPNHPLSISSMWKSFGIVTRSNPSPATTTSVDGDDVVDVATKEHFYHHQIIDHLNPTKEYPILGSDGTPTGTSTTTYTQRYYESTKYFGGPGSPIFIIMGGEDPLDGLLYPFVYNNLAQTFKGYTAAIEHRFFGKSMPLGNDDNTFPDHDDLHQLLTPNQAMLDAVQFIQYKRQELGCHLHRGHPQYCPVISVGGSYPGFLAAVLRMVHSNVVDIGYGSSAPFRLYSHHTDQYAYYDKVTATAEDASPGCADAVRTTLYDAQEDIINSLDEQLHDVGVTYGICRGSIPSYIQTTKLLAQELMLIITTHFANGNMNYYPPGPDQDLVKGCKIFQNPKYKMTEQKLKHICC